MPGMLDKDRKNVSADKIKFVEKNGVLVLVCGGLASDVFYLKSLDSYGALSIKALLEIQNILQMSSNLKNYFEKDYLETSNFSAVEQYFFDLYVNPSIVSTFAKSIILKDLDSAKQSRC